MHVRQHCRLLRFIRRHLMKYIMQRSNAISVNPTLLSKSVAFYISSSLLHPHSHSSTINKIDMKSSEQDPVDSVTVPSPKKRKPRRGRKLLLPKKRKKVPRKVVPDSHHSDDQSGNASSSPSPEDADLTTDEWDPSQGIKDTFGEDCTYLDFPSEEQQPPVEFPWSKEAAEMVAAANFVYDVCCEPYKHLYNM